MNRNRIAIVAHRDRNPPHDAVLFDRHNRNLRGYFVRNNPHCRPRRRQRDHPFNIAAKPAQLDRFAFDPFDARLDDEMERARLPEIRRQVRIPAN